MGRPEAIQWQHRRWLGDQKVLGMDWDAKAMHFHLLMMSIQEEPPGSIPDDMALIRRWLGSPSEDIWRRVRPQVLSAWTLRTDRWFNQGMVETFERKVRFSKRYEKGTKLLPETVENQENSISKELDFDVGSKKFKKPSLEEIREYVRSRGDLISADAFFDYYESVGWKVGAGKPMKKWHNAVGTWEKRLNDPRGQHGKHETDSPAKRRSDANKAALVEALRGHLDERAVPDGAEQQDRIGPEPKPRLAGGIWEGIE